MAELWNNEKYPFLYDTHVHTSESSACAKNSGYEMADAYKAAGYAGIIITDHFYYGNTAADRSLPWREWVEQFCTGYEHARAEGDRIGLQVFFGWESGYRGTEFLIYGPDKEWLLSHPGIRDASVEEQQKLVHDGGGMVIHAHPYREEDYIDEIRLFPQYVDGVEAVNACHSNPFSKAHNDPDYDKKAQLYAAEHDFPATAGSDMHNTELYGGGMAFAQKLTSVRDYINAVCSRRDYIMTDGFNLYDSGFRVTGRV